MNKSTSFYAVQNGRKPGVYKSWAECEAQVKGFSGPRFKKFDNLKEAQDFVKGVNFTISLKTEKKEVNKTNSKENNSKRPRTLITHPASEGLKFSLSEHSESDSSSKKTKNELTEVVYIDGSARGNGKRGARAGVGVFFGDGDPRNYSKPLKGSEQTNNRAELTAGIMALQLSSPNKTLEIKTDSRYLIQGATLWIPGWIKKGWKTSTGTDVKNRDLFEDLHSRLQNRKMSVIWTHVSAHTGIYGNEMADQLAKLGADQPIGP